MNFYRRLDKVYILLLVIFFVCFPKIAMTAEKPADVSPAEIKSSAVNKPDVKLPAIIPPPGNLNRNAIGCVLPLSGQYADMGSKAMDAISLSTGMLNESNETSWKVIFADSRGLPEITKAAIENLPRKSRD